MTFAPDHSLYQDLSGVDSVSTDPNPYNALIEACKNDPVEIKARYSIHRLTRAKQQRAILLAADFQGVNPDPILRGLLDEEARSAEEKTGFVDPRHCLVFWARPPERVRQLVAEVQERLRRVVPNMWFMPPAHVHLTALEVAHSLTPSALAALQADLAPLAAPATDYLHTLAAGQNKAARLAQPMLMFDASAVALSFLPCASKQLDGAGYGGEAQSYTYHHLRRDMWDLCSSTARGRDPAVDGSGVPIASRYVVPSCHLTVGRFVSQVDTSVDGKEGAVDLGKVRAFVEAVDEINAWLEGEFGSEDANANAGADGVSRIGGAEAVNGTEAAAPGHGTTRSLNAGVWMPGEEVGLELRSGTVWYGGGQTVRLGRGMLT